MIKHTELVRTKSKTTEKKNTRFQIYSVYCGRGLKNVTEEKVQKLLVRKIEFQAMSLLRRLN